MQLAQAARQENNASAIELLNDLSSTSGAASGVSSDRAFKWLEKTYKDDHPMSKAWALYVWRMMLPLEGQIGKLDTDLFNRYCVLSWLPQIMID